MALMSFLCKIPWKNILAHTPEILETIKKLPIFKPEDDIQSQLAVMEKNISQQATLIEKLAEQNAQLAKTIETLSARILVMFFLALAAISLSCYALLK